MNITRILIPVVFLLVTGTPNAAPSYPGGLAAHGSLQFDAAAWHTAHAEHDSTLIFAGANMLTLNAKTTALKSAKVEGLIDIIQLYGSYAGYTYTPSDASLLTNRTTAPFITDLRMLYGACYLPFADITLGRQIINLGKGSVFSPVDQFSSIDLTELTFKRHGSDIAMISVPLGTLSGIDVVAELPAGKKDHASAVHFFTTLAGWDIACEGIYRHHSREAIGGVAIKGDALIGITGELVTRYDRTSRDIRYEGMTGIDYSIEQTWIFAAEYYYRSDPSLHFLYDRHNCFGSVQYFINDLMSVSSFVIAGFPIGNCCATLQYQWYILQSVTATAYLRYWQLEYDTINSAMTAIDLPDGDAGLRVVISF